MANAAAKLREKRTNRRMAAGLPESSGGAESRFQNPKEEKARQTQFFFQGGAGVRT